MLVRLFTANPSVEGGGGGDYNPNCRSNRDLDTEKSLPGMKMGEDRNDVEVVRLIHRRLCNMWTERRERRPWNRVCRGTRRRVSLWYRKGKRSGSRRRSDGERQRFEFNSCVSQERAPVRIGLVKPRRVSFEFKEGNSKIRNDARLQLQHFIFYILLFLKIYTARGIDAISCYDEN